MKAEGGSGQYQWAVEHSQVASISGQGVVRSKDIGKSRIVVRDNLNTKNIDRIDLEVI